MTDVVKEVSAENADAAESVSTAEENQETQAQTTEDVFMSELNGSTAKTSSNADDEPTDDAQAPSEEATEQNPAEDASAKGAERRKEQLNSEIRELVAQRNAIREETNRIIREQYNQPTDAQIQTEAELIDIVNPATGDYYTRSEAQAKLLNDRLDRLEAERVQQAYADQVAEAQFAMGQEARRVMADFPMFDPASSEYDATLSERANEILAGAIEVDPQTNLQIGCKIPIYQFYSLLAKNAESAKRQGEISGREAAQRMMGAVDTIGGSRNQKGADDELDGFAQSLLDD